MNPKTLAFLCIASIVFLARGAAAQPAPTPPSNPPSDADVCSESYEHAQEQMRPNQAESKLLRARESLRTCLRSNCKSWMVSDCSKWLGEVETRIPTVVFVAKDSGGHDLTAIRVTKPDGTAIVESLDGRAVELEPGPHDFVFVGPDGTHVEHHALVREGEKAQAVAATFRGSGETKPVGPQEPIGPSREAETPTLRYVGYGATAAGIVGLGLGAIFGLITISKKTSDCDSTGLCDPGTRDSLSTTAAVSTVGFVAGGILAAGGVALILVSPSSSRRVGARVSPNGIMIGGQF